MALDEALGMYAEAAQDLASAGLALAGGNFYNCADLCNQAVEKIVQAIYVLRHDARAPYDHDLRQLGLLINAPDAILADLDALTPYHPEVYLANRTPEEADDEVGGETADDLMRRAREVQRWARPIIMTAS
jgi:HEPN domain-containing protein